MQSHRQPLPIRSLLRPSNWHLLFVVGLGKLIAFIPVPALRHLAGPVGFLLFRVRRVRHTTEANLRACFPDLSEEEHTALAKRTTRELAQSVLECLKFWFGFRSGHRHFQIVDFKGTEHLDAALRTNRGILVLCAHYGSPDANGILLSQLDRGERPYYGIYRQPSDATVDQIVRWGRTCALDEMIPSHNVRRIISSLRSGALLWFAPDLEVTGPGSVFASFFGVPASSTNSVARFAKSADAIVLPTRHIRNDATGRYEFEILPPLTDFPSGNPEVDAPRITGVIEDIVRPDPARYWWCIKRFRARPEGEAPIY
ncbi:MAG: lysophospholipid acyltransferase family protein [Pseudomonadota bacterium]